MGHRRLSILDLSSAGRQPMSSHDGALHIAYNGEVYNYRELRGELEALGHRFRTGTDTEVILSSWQAWGPSSIHRFKGMFAFTLLDVPRNRLYAVRDHFGIKPLFYCGFDNGLAFASEIGPLLEMGGVSREVDAQSVYDYLMFGMTSHRANTMFAEVKRVLGATMLEIDPVQAKVLGCHVYWHPDGEEDDHGGYSRAVEALRDLFVDNVRLHLRSDVQVGSALSGGLDSSAIVCAIRAVEPAADIRTFTYVADGRLSEEAWADMAISSVGAEPVKVRVVPDDLTRDLQELIAAQGEPFGSTSIYAQYRVFEAARAHGIKVMLDGQGADELLAGYPGYQGSYLASLLRRRELMAAARLLWNSGRWPGRSPALVMQFAARHLFPERVEAAGRALVGKGLKPTWLNLKWYRERGVSFEVPGQRLSGPNYLRDSLVETTQRTSLPSLLRYEDRSSMRFSVESRVPFLTSDMAELLIRLPERYLIDERGSSKRIFRDAMRGLVPDAILDRRDKVGFATPESDWSAAGALDLVPKIKEHDVFRVLFALPRLEEYVDDLQRLGSRRDFRIWRIANFVAWAQTFDVRA